MKIVFIAWTAIALGVFILGGYENAIPSFVAKSLAALLGLGSVGVICRLYRIGWIREANAPESRKERLVARVTLISLTVLGIGGGAYEIFEAYARVLK